MSMSRRDSDPPEPRGQQTDETGGGISRRALLTGAAGVAIGTLAHAVSASAQVTGLTPGGGTVPFRLPLGALPTLDPNQYTHNMEIHAHLPGVRFTSGEPLVVMYAKGSQRLLPGGSGFLDISDGRKPVLMETPNVRAGGAVAYNANLKKWIMMTSAGRPLSGANPKFPLGQHHPEYRDKILNWEGHRGIRTYDITNPAKPVLLQEFSTGKRGGGTHHNFYDGGKYAYLDAGWDDDLRMENAQRPTSNGVMIVDMTDPANIKEVSRWWVPGQRVGEEEEYKKYWFADDKSSWTGNHGAMTVPKRVEDGGKIGYAGFGHFGMFVFDLSDLKNPKPIARFQVPFESLGGIPYHTVYPLAANMNHPRLNNLLVGVPETVQPDCREPYKPVQIIDVNDPKNPRLIGMLPRPVPPKEAPYADFCQARGRFGWHNTHGWAAPGVERPEILGMTAFNAGIRLYDLTDPTQPKEVAWFVPKRDGEIENYESWFRGTAETVYIEWDRNLIWLGTHEGTYCLSSPALGKPILEPRPVERWSQTHVNVGWDQQTSKSVYFGRSLREVLGL
jgi:hypothetical protein